MREIDDAEVLRAVTPRELVDACARCLRALGEGRAAQAPKQLLPASDEGFFFSISAVVPQTGWAISKWASYVPGLPGAPGRSTSTILVSPADGGAPVAVLTGMLPTRLRTAASTIALLERLGRLADEPAIGLVGFGPTNEAVAAMLAETSGAARWRVVCRSERSRARARSLLPGEVRAGSAEVLADCDVVISATGATTPVADAAALAPGVTVISLDGARSWNIAGLPVLDDRSKPGDPGDVARIMAGSAGVPAGSILIDQAGSAVTDVALAAVLLGERGC